MEPQCKWVMGLSGFICVLIWFYEFSVCECAWCAQWACLRRFANLRQKNTPGILKHVPCIMNPFFVTFSMVWPMRVPTALRRPQEKSTPLELWSMYLCVLPIFQCVLASGVSFVMVSMNCQSNAVILAERGRQCLLYVVLHALYSRHMLFKAPQGGLSLPGGAKPPRGGEAP